MEQTRTVTTRPSPTARELALEKAITLVMQLRHELEPHLVALSEDERKHMLPVPSELPTVGPEVLQAASRKPVLVDVVADFKPVVVADRLAEAAALAQLTNQLESLVRAVGDTRNAGLAEAFRSLLALYAVAKPLADNDVSYAPISRPLATLFEGRMTSRPKAPKADAA